MSSLADADLRALLADAAGRAERYLADLDERPVAPDDPALAGLPRFDEPLPEVEGDPAATLALLDEAGSAATVASAGGRYFGFVIGGAYPGAGGRARGGVPGGPPPARGGDRMADRAVRLAGRGRGRVRVRGVHGQHHR